MAIMWGTAVYGATNGFRIGYEFTHSWNSGNASVNIRCRMYVQTQYTFSDSNNTFDLSGSFAYYGNAPFSHSAGGSWSSSNITQIYDGTSTVSLSPGQSHTASIQAYLYGVEITSQTAQVSGSHTVTRPGGPPAVPAAPTISEVHSTEATVTMVLPADNGSPITDTSFTLWSAATGGTQVAGDGVVDTRTVHRFTGLNPATTYFAQVSALNAFGWAGRSTRTAFTTLPAAPTVSSTPPAATNISRTSFRIPTTQIVNNGGQAPWAYRAEVRAVGGSSAYHESSGWLAVTVSGRSPATTYEYRVSARNDGGWGPSSNWRTVTTLTTAPSDPAAPGVTNIGETSARVSWVLPAHNDATITGVEIILCLSNNPEVPIRTLTGGPSSADADITGLVKGTTYYVFVRALAIPNNSGWSPATEFRTLGTNSTLFPYYRHNGVWREVEVYQRVNGVWRRVALNYRSGSTWKGEQP